MCRHSPVRISRSDSGGHQSTHEHINIPNQTTSPEPQCAPPLPVQLATHPVQGEPPLSVSPNRETPLIHGSSSPSPPPAPGTHPNDNIMVAPHEDTRNVPLDKPPNKNIGLEDNIRDLPENERALGMDQPTYKYWLRGQSDNPSNHYAKHQRQRNFIRNFFSRSSKLGKLRGSSCQSTVSSFDNWSQESREIQSSGSILTLRGVEVRKKVVSLASTAGYNTFYEDTYASYRKG